jgi:mannose-1-phosphate guanylyltransferase/mannose-6-phosphate isomerase
VTAKPPSIQVVPVILAGGSGTRLWPLSRAQHPKQFLAIGGPDTLFQQAAARLAAIGGDGFAVGSPLVVGNEEHRFTVVDQLRERKTEAAAVLLEPIGRNTAPALTLAALQATVDGEADPVLVVGPADHAIAERAACTAALRTAVRARRTVRSSSSA